MSIYENVIIHVAIIHYCTAYSVVYVFRFRLSRFVIL